MTLVQALAATYQVIGQPVTDTALATMAQELARHPLPDVQEALKKCRNELRRLTLADVLERLPKNQPKMLPVCHAQPKGAMTKEEFGVELFQVIQLCAEHRKVSELLGLVKGCDGKGKDKKDLNIKRNILKGQIEQLYPLLDDTDAARLARQYPWITGGR